MGSFTWLMVVIGISLLGPSSISTQRSADPNERMRQMLNDDDHLMRRVWKRDRIMDQPTHLTPDRVHGGIGP